MPASSSETTRTGVNPYVTPVIVSDPATQLLEATLVADETTADIGGGVTANAQTFNGTIPAPTLMLKVDDTVRIRLINQLDTPTGIHWHGIELHNSTDGTAYTQNQRQGRGGEASRSGREEDVVSGTTLARSAVRHVHEISIAGRGGARSAHLH